MRYYFLGLIFLSNVLTPNSWADPQIKKGPKLIKGSAGGTQTTSTDINAATNVGKQEDSKLAGVKDEASSEAPAGEGPTTESKGVGSDARGDRAGQEAQLRREQQELEIRREQEIREAEIRREQQRVYDQYRNERNFLLSQQGSYGHGRGYVGGEIEYTNIGVNQSVGPVTVQVNVDAEGDENSLDASEADLLARFDAMSALTRDRSVAPAVRQQVIIALRSIERGVPVSDALFAAEKAAGASTVALNSIPEGKKKELLVGEGKVVASANDSYNMPPIIGALPLGKGDQTFNLNLKNNIKIENGAKEPRGAISKLQVKANAQAEIKGAGLSLPASANVLLPKSPKKSDGFGKSLARSLASIGEVDILDGAANALNDRGLAAKHDEMLPELAGAGMYGPQHLPSLGRNIGLVAFGALASLLLFWVFRREEKKRTRRAHAPIRRPQPEGRIYKTRFRG